MQETKLKTLPIELVVTDSSGKELNRMRLDFLKSEDRQRIAKTAWWAMHNGHTLTTRPIDG